MVYKVIGLMSGSSLDGLDIAYVQLEETRGKWAFEVLHAACMPYSQEWRDHLATADMLTAGPFLKLHTAYGHYTGEVVKTFMEAHNLDHKVHFISSHGHTVFHDPENKTTAQIGDGAAIAAVTALPVITDLRAMDIALGGQGAPIVPVGDKLLFDEYNYWLNLGGIANISVSTPHGIVAFDLCPCNQLLDHFARKCGKEYDAEGQLAASGTVNKELLEKLATIPFYELAGPKSLSNDFSKNEVIPMLETAGLTEADSLATAVAHISGQIIANIKRYAGTDRMPAKLLATGGGAFNNFLMNQLQDGLPSMDIAITIPDEQVIQFKEAIIMALLGALRWREEENVFSSVTGASRDSIGGALWLGR